MGGSESKPAPPGPAVAPSATAFQRTPQWKIDDYMAALDAYNRPFTQIVVSADNGKYGLSTQTYTTNYNPPQPPWVAANSADNVFLYQTGVYINQLKDARATIAEINAGKGDIQMIKILNSPPAPRPPPGDYVVQEPRPVPVSAVPPPVKPAANDYPALYNEYYELGRRILATVGINNYEYIIPKNPPASDDPKRRIDEKFFELRDVIRRAYADKTGTEPAILGFPYEILKNEGFLSTQQRRGCNHVGHVREGFALDKIAYNGYYYRCVNLSEQRKWAAKTLLDKEATCAAYGHIYIEDLANANGCMCFQKLEAVGESPKPSPPPAVRLDLPPGPLNEGERPNTELAAEPDTAALYKYKMSLFDPAKTTYEVPKLDGKDGDSYAAYFAAKSGIKIADIKEYYDELAKYNHYWMNMYGWRADSDPAYNPPRPFWFTNGNSPEAKEYMRTIKTFSDKAAQLKSQFNAGVRGVPLPQSFGELPAPPEYPSTLHELLLNPRAFAKPDQAGGLPSLGPAPTGGSGGGSGSSSAPAPAVEFQIPVTELEKVLKYVKESPPPTASASVRPKCGGDQPCMRFNDEVPDIVKQFFEQRAAQKTLRSRGGNATTGTGPISASGNGSTTSALMSYYERIKPSLVNDVKSMMGTESLFRLGQ